MPMDYSASIHDADHPSGASPWGASPAASPHVDRTTFEPVADVVPASPPAFESQISGNGFGAGNDDGGFGSPDHVFRRPVSVTTVSEGDTYTQETEPIEGDSPVDYRQFLDENLAPPQAQDANRLSGDTARASQEQPQPRKPSKPVDKLQAKITGLERAARKDPILRFDVHVGHTAFLLVSLSLSQYSRMNTDQYFKVPNNSVSRRETLTFRIRKAGRTLNICESGSHGSCSTTPSDICWCRH